MTRFGNPNPLKGTLKASSLGFFTGPSQVIGAKFWEVVCADHGIDSTGRYQATRSCNWSESMCTTTRRVVEVRAQGSAHGSGAGHHGQCLIGTVRPDFPTRQFCFWAVGAGNNWAKGHYIEGAELIDSVLDVVREGG
ncbi:Tubulin beta-8 chain [Vitis vinifera]|uniref:Tubulin beta-8 chain n=1 Tax=Vitis vinifera TaxID=29760 RepID=A0A438IYX3_VITVI|nr:Tubulin beta-8 chain [Vitis vinifera]